MRAKCMHVRLEKIDAKTEQTENTNQDFLELKKIKQVGCSLKFLNLQLCKGTEGHV